jgi:hypothetical protein
MTAGRFVKNDAGFRAMAVGPELRAAVQAEAERAMVIAQGLAADFTDTGEYEASFEVHTETQTLRTGFGSHPVAAAILENTSDHAVALEWGNEHVPVPHRVPGRTLDGLGHA